MKFYLFPPIFYGNEEKEEGEEDEEEEDLEKEKEVVVYSKDAAAGIPDTAFFVIFPRYEIFCGKFLLEMTMPLWFIGIINAW